MTDEETNVLGYICDIQGALDGLIVFSGQITPEDKTKLSRAYIRCGDLLTELMERKHDLEERQNDAMGCGI